MEIPHGFGLMGGNNNMCQLKKALYRLKQSPRVWFGIFTKVIVCFGYK